MDQEGLGGARVPHVMVLGAMDSRTVQAAMRPALERSRTQGAAHTPRCVVVAPTPAAVLLAADEARRVLGDGCRVVPVTSVTRARRVLGSAPLSVVVGTPGDIRALRKSADLSLDELSAVVFLGVDDMLASEDATTGRDALDALLSDVPSTVMRIATASQESEAVQTFQQQHLPKARQITPHVAQAPMTGVAAPHYLIVSPLQRAAMLRAVLDERDPPSVAVIASGEVAQAEARETLASLGLPVDNQTVQVVEREPQGHTAAVIGWGAPVDASALQSAMSGAPVFAVFLAGTDDIVHLQTISGNAAQPFVLRSSSARARGESSALVRAVRETMTSAQGLSAADYALLAPLLETHDPMEIAAAAVRQLGVTQRQLREAQEALTHRRVTVLSQVIREEAAPAASGDAATATDSDATGSAPVARESASREYAPRERPSFDRDSRGGDSRDRDSRDRPSFDRRTEERGERSFGDRPRGGKSFGDKPRGGKFGKSFGDKPRGGKSFGDKPRGGKPFGDRPRGERSFGDKPYGDRPRGERTFGDRPRGDKPFGDRPRGDRPFSDRPRGERSFSDRPRGDKPFGDRPRGDRPFGDRPRGDRPFGDRPRGERSFGDRPRGERSFGDRPRGDKPFGDRPRGDRPFGDRPRSGDRDRQAFSDRSPRERTEQRGEWAARGERLSHSKRPRRDEA